MATLVDALGAEDRVQVKFSDFYALVKAAETGKILKNAVNAEIPYEQIRKMLTGRNDELEEYRKTELTPDQIREIDHLYSEKCVEVAMVTAEKETSQKQMADLIKNLDLAVKIRDDGIMITRREKATDDKGSEKSEMG